MMNNSSSFLYPLFTQMTSINLLFCIYLNITHQPTFILFILNFRNFSSGLWQYVLNPVLFIPYAHDVFIACEYIPYSQSDCSAHNNKIKTVLITLKKSQPSDLYFTYFYIFCQDTTVQYTYLIQFTSTLYSFIILRYYYYFYNIRSHMVYEIDY